MSGYWTPPRGSRGRRVAGRASWRFRRATASFRLRPTFLIIGAQKAGTTSLHRYLSENPAVFLASPKEVRYFHKNYERGDRWYRAQFPLRVQSRIRERRIGVRPVIGEASPIYLFDPRAPGRVHAFDPGMKLIAIVRDPVDRAYSHYHMQLRWGFEKVSFEQALDREEMELDAELALVSDEPPIYPDLVNRLSYVARGRYTEQLERWLALFPREQLLVLLSEELLTDTPATMQRVTSFLGIPHLPATTYPLLGGGGGLGEYEPMDPATRDRLARIFEPHNRRLEELLGRELAWTRAPAPAPSRTPTQPA